MVGMNDWKAKAAALFETAADVPSGGDELVDTLCQRWPAIGAETVWLRMDQPDRIVNVQPAGLVYHVPVGADHAGDRIAENVPLQPFEIAGRPIHIGAASDGAVVLYAIDVHRKE